MDIDFVEEDGEAHGRYVQRMRQGITCMQGLYDFYSSGYLFCIVYRKQDIVTDQLTYMDGL